MMRIDLLTLFPAMAEGILHSSILSRAQKIGAVEFFLHQLRDYAQDKHRTVDDRPFGGGPGMILKCEPIVNAIEAIEQMDALPAHVIYLTPQGQLFNQAKAVELSQRPRLLFVSGHYEGMDERVCAGGWIDEEISIGDYILTNGTLPSLVVADAVARLLPGVLGNENSAREDSFGAQGYIEGPQYTRPEIFRGMEVPQILLGGHHAAIAAWRAEQALERTRQRRADLLQVA